MVSTATIFFQKNLNYDKVRLELEQVASFIEPPAEQVEGLTFFSLASALLLAQYLKNGPTHFTVMKKLKIVCWIWTGEASPCKIRVMVKPLNYNLIYEYQSERTLNKIQSI